MSASSVILYQNIYPISKRFKLIFLFEICRPWFQKVLDSFRIRLEKDDVKEGLEFDNKDLSNEDLYEMSQPRAQW